MWTCPRRIYLDKHGKAVEAGDPGIVDLLCGVDERIPLEQAQKLGLVDKDGRTVEPKKAGVKHEQ